MIQSQGSHRILPGWKPNGHEFSARRQVISTLVVGDHPVLGQRACDLLLRRGLECPQQGIVSPELAMDRAARLPPDVIVVQLSPNPERGLSTIRELSNVPRACLVALGPASDPQLILAALHAGAHEYVDEEKLETQLTDAIVRFKNRRADQSESSKSGNVVAVLGPSGGVGASLVAINVATVLARQCGRAGLVDLRSANGDLASLLDVQPRYSIADLCENVSRLDTTMFSQFLVRHEQGVHLLAAPPVFGDVRNVTARGVASALFHARRQFSYTVVDVQNTLEPEQIEALWQAATILLVVRLDYTSLRNAQRRCEDLRQLGMAPSRLRLVVNRYGMPKQVPVREAEQALRMTISDYIPEDAARVHRAINTGTPLVVQFPLARISRRLGQLATSVAAECPLGTATQPAPGNRRGSKV